MNLLVMVAVAIVVIFELGMRIDDENARSIDTVLFYLYSLGMEAAKASLLFLL